MNSNAIQDTKIPEIFDSDEKSGHLLGADATACTPPGGLVEAIVRSARDSVKPLLLRMAR